MSFSITKSIHWYICCHISIYRHAFKNHFSQAAPAFISHPHHSHTPAPIPVQLVNNPAAINPSPTQFTHATNPFNIPDFMCQREKS